IRRLSAAAYRGIEGGGGRSDTRSRVRHGRRRSGLGHRSVESPRGGGNVHRERPTDRGTAAVEIGPVVTQKVKVTCTGTKRIDGDIEDLRTIGAGAAYGIKIERAAGVYGDRRGFDQVESPLQILVLDNSTRVYE